MARFTFSLLALILGVAILPGALSVGDKYRKGGNTAIEDDSSEEDEDDEGVWLFHFGPVNSREEYLDPLTGEVRGYHIDVLNAVCNIADKNCQTVYDLSKNCWDNIDGVPVGGVGLHNFYYDCCTAWYPTYARLRTFQFSKAFNTNTGSGFAVRAGNRGGFDPTDLTGQRIGFIQGFFSDPDCIRRQTDITGSDLEDDQIVFFASADELKEAVLSGRGDEAIDAAFDWATNYNQDDRFDFLNEEDSQIQCAVAGPGMMCRKDNELNEWFNPALCTLLASPEYQVICDNVEDENVHGHKPGPDRAGVCVDVADVCGDYEDETATGTTEEPAR